MLYDLLFDFGIEGVIITDQCGVIEIANDRAADIFGYSKAEFIGLNVDQLVPMNKRLGHSGLREGYAENPHKRRMGVGSNLSGARKDGIEVPVEVSLNYFKSGDGVKVLALIMDVTVRREQAERIQKFNRELEQKVELRTRDLKASQQLYQVIARNYPNGTINVFDRSFRYIFAEGEEMYKSGITSEWLVGKNYLDRVPKEVRLQIKDHLASVLDGKNATFEIEFDNQFYLINTVGLADDSGEIDRILLVEQNITQRKEAEVKLEKALEKEINLNELKSRFVSMASHEFRTPLSTVLSSMSLLEKYDALGANEKKGKHYERIRNSVRQLTNILNDFLSLEKVEEGKINIQPTQVDLPEMMVDIVDEHNQMAKEGQQIVLDCNCDSEFFTDQNMLRIVVSNLLSNAIKYSPEGVTINITSFTSNDQLTIKVEDKGIGIPADEQEHLFERFFRARNAVNIEGTGLGLNIVSRYLQHLNGNITFVSDPDVGTTFTVSLPMHVKQ